MLHKLDLSQTNTPQSDTESTSQVLVDDERLVTNNQTSDAAQKNSVTTPSMRKKSLTLTIIVSVVAILAGIGTGYGTHRLYAGSDGSLTSSTLEQVPTGTVKAGDVFGSTNRDTFKDKAKGYLEKGGLDGEGSHRLLRPGGPSQTVYMTSSVTDLDKFDGMEVEVWGETFSSQKAGWLMDVGSVEVLNVKGERPAEAEE